MLILYFFCLYLAFNLSWYRTLHVSHWIHPYFVILKKKKASNTTRYSKTKWTEMTHSLKRILSILQQINTCVGWESKMNNSIGKSTQCSFLLACKNGIDLHFDSMTHQLKCFALPINTPWDHFIHGINENGYFNIILNRKWDMSKQTNQMGMSMLPNTHFIFLFLHLPCSNALWFVYSLMEFIFLWISFSIFLVLFQVYFFTMISNFLSPLLLFVNFI